MKSNLMSVVPLVLVVCAFILGISVGVGTQRHFSDKPAIEAAAKEQLKWEGEIFRGLIKEEVLKNEKLKKENYSLEGKVQRLETVVRGLEQNLEGWQKRALELEAEQNGETVRSE